MLIFIYIIRWSGVTFTGPASGARGEATPSPSTWHPCSALRAPSLPSARFCCRSVRKWQSCRPEPLLAFVLARRVFGTTFTRPKAGLGYKCCCITGMLFSPEASAVDSIFIIYLSCSMLLTMMRLLLVWRVLRGLPFALITVRRHRSVSMQLLLFLSRARVDRKRPCGLPRGRESRNSALIDAALLGGGRDNGRRDLRSEMVWVSGCEAVRGRSEERGG